VVSVFSRSVFSRSAFSRSVFSRSGFSRSVFSRHPYYDYTFQKCMNSYIYIKVTTCNNIFVVTAYSLKLRKFRGQRVKCPETKFLVTPLDACSDDNFCCEIVDGKCKLKVTHPYYAQVQGQMGITGVRWWVRLVR